MEKIRKDVDKAYAVLELDRKIVGIKLVKSKEEFNSYQATKLKKPLSYCVAVKSAMTGKCIKLKKDTSGCGGSTVALGLDSPSEDFFNGKSGCKLGLYNNETIAAKVAEEVYILPSETYGVVIGPLEMFHEKPDIAIIVCNTKNMMRIVQGYSYYFGLNPNFRMSGNQAICIECSSTPIITNDINISLLCSGTRFLAKWKEDEVAIGIPIDKFSTIVDGVLQTVNSVEMDDRKKAIEENLLNIGENDFEIVYGKTYYTELEKEKRMRKNIK